jgi:hypothetical protein
MYVPRAGGLRVGRRAGEQFPGPAHTCSTPVHHRRGGDGALVSAAAASFSARYSDSTSVGVFVRVARKSRLMHGRLRRKLHRVGNAVAHLRIVAHLSWDSAHVSQGARRPCVFATGRSTVPGPCDPDDHILVRERPQG